jgi:hypothetical protein
MKIHSLVAAVLTAATFALAGCAADGTGDDHTAAAQQGVLADDKAHVALAGDQVNVGGRAGIALADDPTNRMYEFANTPRIAERLPHEVSLTELDRASSVPFSTDAERDIAREQDSNAGVGGPNP